jgi:hypothetical protein
VLKWGFGVHTRGDPDSRGFSVRLQYRLSPSNHHCMRSNITFTTQTNYSILLCQSGAHVIEQDLGFPRVGWPQSKKMFGQHECPGRQFLLIRFIQASMCLLDSVRHSADLQTDLVSLRSIDLDGSTTNFVVYIHSIRSILQGSTGEELLRRMDTCKSSGIATFGHPVVHLEFEPQFHPAHHIFATNTKEE